MNIAVIIIFFLFIIIFGFCRGLHHRTKSENAFYALSIVISLSVLLLKSFDVAIPDPTKFFTQLIHESRVNIF
ncbi:MAG TPA: hypothetical protein PKD52_08815 [Clostridiales bacterium]|nr:hypothetical protein [Clostridiales bacterium]